MLLVTYLGTVRSERSSSRVIDHRCAVLWNRQDAANQRLLVCCLVGRAGADLTDGMGPERRPDA